MDQTKKIGNRIKEVCRILKISQNTMAKELSISSGSLSDLVTGKRLPSDKFYKKIRLIYGIRTEWLKFGTGEVFLYGKYTDSEERILQIYENLGKKEQEVVLILLEALSALTEKRQEETESMEE